MGNGESAVAAVDWGAVDVMRGTGDELAATLLALMHSTTREEIDQLWPEIEGVSFASQTLWGRCGANH